MKEILDTPPRSVIDFYIDVFVEICHTFRSDPKMQLANSSINWLVESLKIVPMNVFTDDEKQRMLLKFIQSDNSRHFLS